VLLLLCVEEAVMPELPEVEQARKLFVRCCSGRRIVRCKVEQVSRSKVKCVWEN
jgi:formamidopyrimidine-DNA glycosylase